MSALAEWTNVGGDNDSTCYVDLSTILRKGDIVTMWDVEDLNTAKSDANGKYMSSIRQSEYDCKEERYRTDSFFNMSEKMGKGRVVHSSVSKPGEWIAITPDGVAKALWTTACGKKQ